VFLVCRLGLFASRAQKVQRDGDETACIIPLRLPPAHRCVVKALGSWPALAALLRCRIIMTRQHAVMADGCHLSGGTFSAFEYTCCCGLQGVPLRLYLR
jgi:hypothetical protein